MTKQGRGHSTLFISRVRPAELSKPVARLARACIKYNVSVVSIADDIGVTRATVYNWLVGFSEPRPQFLPRIEKLTALLTQRK